MYCASLRYVNGGTTQVLSLVLVYLRLMNVGRRARHAGSCHGPCDGGTPQAGRGGPTLARADQDVGGARRTAADGRNLLGSAELNRDLSARHSSASCEQEHCYPEAHPKVPVHSSQLPCSHELPSAHPTWSVWDQILVPLPISWAGP